MCLILTVIATFPLKRLFILCCNLLLSYLFFTLLGKPNEVKDGTFIFTTFFFSSLHSYNIPQKNHAEKESGTLQDRYTSWGCFLTVHSALGQTGRKGNKSQCWWSFIRLDYDTTEKWPNSDPNQHPLLKCPCSSLWLNAQRKPSCASLMENCPHGNRMPEQWIFPLSHHGTPLTLVSLGQC